VAKEQVLPGNEWEGAGSGLWCRDEAEGHRLGLIKNDALATLEAQDQRKLDAARPEISRRAKGDPEPLRAGGQQPDRLQGSTPVNAASILTHFYRSCRL
jgi:hypothetical protein